MSQSPGPSPPPTRRHLPGRARDLLRQLSPTGALVLVTLSLPAAGLLFARPLGNLGLWLRAHEPGSLLLFVGLGVALASLALLPAWALALLAGWAFGTPRGSAAAMVGLVGGAILAYAIAARVSGDHVTTLIRGKPKWNRVYQTLAGSGFWRTTLVIALVRIPPVPFAFTNVALAALRVRRPAFVLGTLLGLAPRTVGWAYIGATLTKLDWATLARMDSSGLHATWLQLAGIASTLVVLAVLGYLAHRALHRMTGPPETPPSGTEPRP